VTEAPCLEVIASAPFVEGPDRQFFALPALAVVRPMSSETAAVFEKANGQGAWSFNGPLLATNGSDRALTILEAAYDGMVAAPVTVADLFVVRPCLAVTFFALYPSKGAIFPQ